MVKTLIRSFLNSSVPVGLTNESKRSKWIIEKLKQISNGARLLDAGAGEQPYRRFCSHVEYVSQDFCQYTGEGAIGLQVRNWHFGQIDIVCDIIDIPEADLSFDAVLCTEVLEHITNPVKVFPEFARLLKSNGSLIITAPFGSLTHFAPHFYQTGFSKFFFEHHLKANGFEIVELEYNGNYFEYLAQELRRLDSVSKKYTNASISFFDRIYINKLLRRLNRLSLQDKHSDELLCFGLHIHARKK